jgi:hypothetical protein
MSASLSSLEIPAQAAVTVYQLSQLAAWAISVASIFSNGSSNTLDYPLNTMCHEVITL